MGTILIRGLEITAKHGALAREKVEAQPFVFDMDMTLDFENAAEKDDLSLTANYAKACDIIAEITASNTFDLIETLAYSCAYRLCGEFSPDSLKLTVYKPRAPIAHAFKTVGASVELKRERVFLSLGSSEGDKEAYLKRGVELLGKTRGITVEKVSSFFETEPVGGVAKNQFLNCAVEIYTYLQPLKLLEKIHEIEAECGRVRGVRWGDRTLDIDIIFYGKRVIFEDALQVPHPEYAVRSFVLEPLAEIAPDFVCPVFHKKIRNLLQINNCGK